MCISNGNQRNLPAMFSFEKLADCLVCSNEIYFLFGMQASPRIELLLCVGLLCSFLFSLNFSLLISMCFNQGLKVLPDLFTAETMRKTELQNYSDKSKKDVSRIRFDHGSADFGVIYWDGPYGEFQAQHQEFL